MFTLLNSLVHNLSKLLGKRMDSENPIDDNTPHKAWQSSKTWGKLEWRCNFCNENHKSSYSKGEGTPKISCVGIKPC